MHKFFVSNDNICEDIAVIKDEDVKHIYKVLRLTGGDEVTINDCEGIEYLGEILSVDKKEVKVKLLERMDTNTESPLNVVLFQGLPKSSKMDLIVQKGTWHQRNHSHYHKTSGGSERTWRIYKNRPMEKNSAGGLQTMQKNKDSTDKCSIGL